MTGQYDICFQEHLKIAERGYPLAECQVGYFYLSGYGTEVNLEKGVYWTRRAAEHADRDAQFNLAALYEEGRGVEIDLRQALAWYRLAAAQGHEAAKEKCKQAAMFPEYSAL